MQNFNQQNFTYGALAGIETTIGVVAASTPAVADIIDRQRLIDHAVMQARLARARSALARRRLQAQIADADASAALRYAASRQ